MSTKLFTFLFLINLLITTGCATKSVFIRQDIGRERKVSTAVEPTWIKVVPMGYFIGMSGDREQEVDARQEALRNAQRAITEKLGVKIESEEIEKIITTGSTKDVLASNVFNQAQMNAVGKSILKVSADEYYIEKWEKSTSRGVEYFYKAWTKVRFSEEEHKNFIEETVSETLSLVKSLIREGSDSEAKGKYTLAINRYMMAVQSLKEISDLSGLPPRYLAEIKKVEIETKNRLKEIENQIAGKTKIIVFIEERILGKKRDSSIIESRIVEALKRKQVTLISKKIKPATEEEMIKQAKDYGATILVSGRAEAEKISQISDELYSTRARVIIKVFSLEESKTLAVFDIPDKTFSDTRGFGITAQSAAQDALSLKRAEGFFDAIAERIEKVVME